MRRQRNAADASQYMEVLTTAGIMICIWFIFIGHRGSFIVHYGMMRLAASEPSVSLDL